MKFVQAQFSLKYDPQVKIRRSANDIEDFLQQHYGTPQTMPIPDEIAPEAPRIILYSKNGHSQINFSQISVDFIVNFDSDFVSNFDLTKEYIQERASLIIDLLKRIGIDEYLFCGITYNARIDIGDKKPIEFITKYLGSDIPQGDLYEASRNIAIVKNERFFVNQKIGTYKEFQGIPGSIPNLFEIGSIRTVSEGVSLALDINNRYDYVYHKKKNQINGCAKDIDDLFSILIENIAGWE